MFDVWLKREISGMPIEKTRCRGCNSQNMESKKGKDGLSMNSSLILARKVTSSAMIRIVSATAQSGMVFVTIELRRIAKYESC